MLLRSCALLGAYECAGWLGDAATHGIVRASLCRRRNGGGCYRKFTDRSGRAQRWRDAVAEPVELQADCQLWLDGLPEGLADTATADALRVVCEVDLSGLEVDPPQGFGRD